MYLYSEIMYICSVVNNLQRRQNYIKIKYDGSKNSTD